MLETKKLPDEIFRKLLHGVLLGSLAVWVHVFPNWWMTALSAAVFAAAAREILQFFLREWLTNG